MRDSLTSAELRKRKKEKERASAKREREGQSFRFACCSHRRYIKVSFLDVGVVYLQYERASVYFHVVMYVCM